MNTLKLRKIVEVALKHRAVSVIIAHNHPGGVAEPSDNDDKITEQIKNALQTVGISLQDHLVIAGNEYFSYQLEKDAVKKTFF